MFPQGWLNQLGGCGRRGKLFSQPTPRVKHRKQVGIKGGFCRQRVQMGWHKEARAFLNDIKLFRAVGKTAECNKLLLNSRAMKEA